MAHGMEGPFKSADVRMIRNQENLGSDAEALISAESLLAETIADNTRLVAALRGEEYFTTIQNEQNPDKQIGLALAILRNTPYIVKYLPPHITEEGHRAALVVGIAKALKESTQRMN